MRDLSQPALQEDSVLTVTVNPALDRIALVRDFQSGGPMRPIALLVAAGGSGVHAAQVAHVLGAPVVVQGFFGGQIGHLASELAQQRDLMLDVTEIDGQTRVNYVIVDEDLGYRLEIPETGPTVRADDVERLTERYRAAVANAAVVVLSSGLPPGCPENVYADLVAQTPDDVPVIVDTHSGALEQVWDARPEIIKVNEPEFCALLGMSTVAALTPQDILAATAGMRAGPSWLAVTLAERGAVLVHAREAWHSEPPSIATFNPSGSGDTFVGSFAASLREGADPADAIVRATAAGAGNVRGLAVGYCDPRELPALVDQTTHTQITTTG